MSKNMIIAVVIIAALIAAGGVFLHMVKESGKREYEQKQEVAAAERQEQAVKAQIVIEKETIDDIKIKMKNKYTRD